MVYYNPVRRMAFSSKMASKEVAVDNWELQAFHRYSEVCQSWDPEQKGKLPEDVVEHE
jgi:hypothetical protein